MFLSMVDGYVAMTPVVRQMTMDNFVSMSVNPEKALKSFVLKAKLVCY
jgi:hypothetical protein